MYQGNISRLKKENDSLTNTSTMLRSSLLATEQEIAHLLANYQNLNKEHVSI